jgi:hypothetical protein
MNRARKREFKAKPRHELKRTPASSQTEEKHRIASLHLRERLEPESRVAFLYIAREPNQAKRISQTSRPPRRLRQLEYV